MTLMKLAPESIRLRRMAKAHAAGEMTEAEYREARREMIDQFPAVPVDDDDTRPRWAEEPTLRGRALAADGAGDLSREAPPTAGRRWLWLAALGLMLAAAAMAVPDAFAAGAPADVVPPVRDRDPDPASSPRLPIREVHVRWGGGAADKLPDVALETLQGRAEEVLAEVRARNTPGPHGFTGSELAEVARFLNVLGVHQGEGGLDAADARDLEALIREQKTRRGISVSELEDVAEAVQAEVRSRGYFLAVAYLPAQRLEDGTARIDVLPGRLGEVVVEGGDADPVAGAFSPLLGQPLTLAEVSSRLQALNALPGVTAQASFGPGTQVGESRLRLDLLEQRDWVAAVTADNHGEEETGEQRLGVTASWLNPRHAGDRLSAGGLFAVNPSNQTYGYLDYDTPLGRGFRLSTRIGNNDFSHEAPIDLEGNGWFLDVAARRSLTHSRERGLTLVMAAARQSLDWDAGVDQTVTVAGAGLAGHRVLDRPRIAADAALSLSAGHIGGDRFLGQDSGFWFLELDSEAWLPVSLPWLEGEQKLLARLAGQWSDSLLPATQRFALGGAARARGFDRDVFLADRGVLLGLEARIPIRLGELVVFSEVAYGDALAEGNETWARLSDAGLGWDAQLAGALSSRLSWSLPLTTRGTGGIDDDGSRLYWSIRYEH
jgi:hemolysin activation/secretion protein